MKLLALILMLAWPGQAFAEAVIGGDAWVKGQVGVGTSSPGARLEVKAASATQTVFQVSAVDDTPLLMTDKSGSVGMSTTPVAKLDISGVADVSDAGMQLRGGNSYPDTGSYQLTFSYNGTSDYRHAIQTSHVNSVSSNSINFLIWEPSGNKAAADLPDRTIVSLVTHATGTAVHIRPADYADADMVVSNGSTIGGGTVHRALEVLPSRKDLKSDISYLGREDAVKAFEELSALKLASFRYKRLKGKKLVRDRKMPFKRGIIYEDAPASIKRAGGFISVDGRILQAELAFQEFIRRLEDSEAQAKSLEAAP